VTDDRPVIDAQTAEELSGRIPVVQAPPTRARFRAERKQRSVKRHRRTGATMAVLGVLLVLMGVLSWWSISGDDSPSPKPAVSGVSVTASTSLPASPQPSTP
jgi:hypothetical protein